MDFRILEIFKGSADDLRRFPVLLVPLLIASIVLFLMLSVLAGAGIITSDSALELGGVSYTLLFIVSLLITLVVEFVAFGVLTCLAYEVVISRVGDIASAFARFKTRFVPLFLVGLIFFVIVVVFGITIALAASALGSYTFVIMIVPALLLALMVLFSFIAVVYEEAGVFEAIAAALRLVSSNLAVMLLFALGLFLIFMVLGLISSILALTPVIGNIISSLLIAAYYSLTIDAAIRVYRELSV